MMMMMMMCHPFLILPFDLPQSFCCWQMPNFHHVDENHKAACWLVEEG